MNLNFESNFKTSVTELRLAQIWEEVLGVKEIGVNSNFFELGGHSLNASNLAARIYKEFQINIPLSEVFQLVTITELADYIEKHQKVNYLGISKVAPQEYYPLSPAQKRLYILNQLDPEAINYNISEGLLIEGQLDRKRFEKAFRELVKRHESMRTSFQTENGIPVQYIAEEVDFTIEYQELTEEEIDGAIRKFVRPFQLNKAPLIRIGLARVSEERHYMLFDMHHIISDGSSMSVLVKEFVSLYKGEVLPELTVQYKDYVAWYDELLKKDFIKKQEQYWFGKLCNELPILNMPTDYLRPSVQSYDGETIRFTTGQDTVDGIKRLCQETNTTPYMVLLATYNILLSKYSGQEEIIVGSPIAGRSHVDLENIIGIFVNTLVFRNHPAGGQRFVDFLSEVKENAIEAYDNQDYPFELLVEKANVTRDLSRNPFFDVMFVLQNMDIAHIKLEGLKFTRCNSRNKIAKFDMVLYAMESENELEFALEYKTQLFKQESILKLISHFGNILTGIINHSDSIIYEIDMLSEEEKHQLLFEFNNTKEEYPREKGLHELFETQVERNPDKIAVDFQGRELSYQELNQKANHIAHCLREKGIGENQTVGIMVERSLELIIGILGILKSGGAYIPIDPDYPQGRIDYLLSNSQAAILLTSQSGKLEIKTEAVDVLEIGELLNQPQLRGDNLDLKYNPDRLLYVLYTSGSTGNPKGVMIKVRSFVNLITWYTNDFGFGADDHVLLIAPISFDLAQKNLYAPLVTGGKLCIFNPGRYKYKLMSKVIEQKEITSINCAPSAFYPLMDFNEASDYKCLRSLKYVFLGGEPINMPKLQGWLKSSNCRVEIVNTYGPTECTDVVSFYRYQRELDSAVENPPIGKPVYNTQLYILDRNHQVAPVGVVGELYVGGDGVGKGYYNQEGLTSEKFVHCQHISGGRIYKTGDLVKWREDGNIEFIGRADNQVKIRGYRIELGEIESRLLKYQGIKEAIVEAKSYDGGHKYLCGYIVADGPVNIGELRKYLGAELPEFMVPSYIVPIARMPLTPNGKIDHRALPEPGLDLASV
ncbi:MAG TPA: amino acid adenylation domain-containing protein [Clostridia bacterium]|nr:amino acid adenylation domain-containing protein [Clostridia bacterium]